MQHVVITGGNTGLGLASARSLAASGRRVTLAVRDTARGEAAAAAIVHAVPDARVAVRRLDLAEPDSVAAFADRLDEPVHVLLNNAGVMLVPQRTVTPAGFEAHMGVNHLGHFLLTALLLPRLERSGGRVVTVASVAHRRSRRLDRGLGLTGRYDPMRAYGQSKLAQLMFALELDRRLRARGSTAISVAAHPGWSATDQRDPRDRGDDPSSFVVLSRRISRLLGSRPDHGAASQVRAALDRGLTGGEYLGPAGLLVGRPHRAAPSAGARNRDDARWLMRRSAELTGVAL